MNPSPPTRLILDPPAEGAWNMAVDEALLQCARPGDPCTLRFYGWKSATLSLGYFQPLETRAEHPGSQFCPVVRRASGGGAIVHDRELTYSLVVPAGQPLARQADHLYARVHGTLIDSLARRQIRARCWPDGDSNPRRPFLCFQRRSPGDVVLEDHKICGSAQRRSRQAVLLHGSVLLGRSPSAEELPGVTELTGLMLSAPELTQDWLANWPSLLGKNLQEGALSEAERAAANQWKLARYENPGWTCRR